MTFLCEDIIINNNNNNNNNYNDTKERRAQSRVGAKYVKQLFQESERCVNQYSLLSFRAGGLVTWAWLNFKITMKQCLLGAF